MSSRTPLHNELIQWLIAVLLVVGGIALWRYTARAQASAGATPAQSPAGFGSTCQNN